MGLPSDAVKWTNHFKNGMTWLGNTTYRENYKEPLSDQYSLRVQVIQKLEPDPKYSHQYCKECVTQKLLIKTISLIKEKEFVLLRLSSKHEERENSQSLNLILMRMPISRQCRRISTQFQHLNTVIFDGYVRT
jgi:hypothetical protein